MFVRFLHLLIIAGCISSPCGAHAQVTSFDGTYRGDSTGNGCSKLNAVLRVNGGAATMRYNPQITFEGKVATDGSLDITQGRSTLNGKFTGGTFNGYASSGRCQYRLTLTK